MDQIALKYLEGRALQRAQIWDDLYTNDTDAPPSQRIEWRGRAQEAAAMAEIVRELLDGMER